MYELMPAGTRSWYIRSPAKIGVIAAGDGGVYLVDSGGDREAARKVRQILDGRGWRLEAIVNTHSNADHIGGNGYLQKQTGCPVFAAGIEAALTRHPILEPAFLYGGYPPKALRHKFLLAEESRVTAIEDGSFPGELGILELPGHFFQMIGIRAPDGTVFIGDALSGRETLEKYRITFIYDVARYLDTLSMLEALEAPLFIPAHAEATPDIAPLAAANRAQVLEIGEKLLDLVREPVNFETILKELFSFYNLSLNFDQYVLAGSTIKSYLSWHLDAGRVGVEFSGNMMLWRRIR